MATTPPATGANASGGAADGRRSCGWSGGSRATRPIIQGPKSAAARRIVKLVPETVAALRTHKSRQNATRLELDPIWHDLDLVFSTGEGRLFHPTNLYRNLNATIAR